MEQNTHITGAEALLRALIEEGVEVIFGYPGGSIMPIYDVLYDYSDRLRHIFTRHEQGAVHAAEGYARATGRTGVSFATSGPGATNIITGVADAMIDSTPLVCITAQVPFHLLGTDAFQEADIISMTTPITKWNYQIISAEEIPQVIAKAFYIARTGRPGPVVIDITKNAQTETIDFDYHRCSGLNTYTALPSFDPRQAEEAADLLNRAERPLILFGQGVKLSGAEQTLIRLSEEGNIPMAGTLMGLSAVPSDHPNYIGMTGMHGNIASNLMTQESDVILAVGMRFSDRVTGDLRTYARQAKVIHIDIDFSELGRVVSPYIAINGDARQALEAICRHIVRRERPDWFAFAASQHDREWKSVVRHDLQPEGNRITMGETIDCVAKLTQGEAIIVTDVGQQQIEAARYSQFRHTRSLITSGGLGTMGYGLPAAIGAKIGCPDRPVILFAGDGGIQMTIQELGTVMEQQTDIKIIILNNSFLGMVRQWQELFFDKRYSSTRMLNPDFTQIAAAYGIAARRITQRNELEGAIAEMMAVPGAYLLDVCVEEESNVFPMIPSGCDISRILCGDEKQNDPHGAQ